jgi:hypothetical protein
MRPYSHTVLFFIVAFCGAVSAQKSIVLTPNLKKGDKITLKTRQFKFSAQSKEASMERSSDEEVYEDDTYEVLEDKDNELIFKRKKNEDFYKSSVAFGNTGTLGMGKGFQNLADFQFGISKKGEDVNIIFTPQMIKDYCDSVCKNDMFFRLALAPNYAEKRKAAKGDTTQLKLIETEAKAFIRGVVEEVVTENKHAPLYQLNARCLFPFLGKSLELGKTISDKAIIPYNLGEDNFGLVVDRTYTLNSLDEEKADITAIHAINTDTLATCSTQILTLFQYVTLKSNEKNGKKVDYGVIKAQEAEIVEYFKDIKITVKHHYIFDVKTGLPLKNDIEIVEKNTKLESENKLSYSVTFEK